MKTKQSAARKRNLRRTKKKKLLDKLLRGKLSAYSAAAGVVLAGGAALKADVVHTSVNVTLSSDGDSYEIDFNNDSSIDAIINMSTQSDTGTESSYTWASGSNWVGIEGPAEFLLDNDESYPSPIPLNLGDAVNGTNWGNSNDDGSYVSLGWKSFYRYQYVSGPNAGDGSSSSSTWGNFLGESGKYVGVRFEIDEDTHFGWIQVDVNNDANDAVITGYAYNDDPGGNIDAGETPEPSTLGLLALGAAGVAVRRRRRRPA